jgi:sugar lactone lactonase YvrE
MKKQFSIFKMLLFTANLSMFCAQAQAPIISYSGVAASYPTGTVISPLTVTNTGGAVTGLIGTTTTFAGSTFGFLNGTGTAAQFNNPAGIAVDATGNTYVADRSNHCIRKITAAGVVTVLAGSTTSGSTDGSGTAAKFNNPYGLVVDALGNVYVADTDNNLIRKITAAGLVTTLAGSTNGYADGSSTTAKFKGPRGVAIDASGNVYVADTANYRIRKITNAGIVTTLAGYASTFSAGGSADGTGTAALFNLPTGLTVDASGTIYVADSSNSRIRKITSTAVVTTVAGSNRGFADGIGASALFKDPAGITIDALGNLYVADSQNNRIRKINTSGLVTTLAGSGTAGIADGSSTAAEFNNPSSISINTFGIMYVADFNNHRVRKVETLGFSVSPELPDGLSINANGLISGTPTAVAPSTTYTITACNLSGSATSTVTFAVTAPLATSDFDFSTKISVYPNPSNAIFKIESDSNATIGVYDLLGKQLLSKKIELGTSALDMTAYQSGIYLLKVINENNQSKTIKIVKE